MVDFNVHCEIYMAMASGPARVGIFSSKSMLVSPLCVLLPACPLAVDGSQDSIFVYHFEEPLPAPVGMTTI